MTEDFDFLFAKSKLPSGIINLGIGENNILREAVVEAYNLKNLSLENLPHIFEYAPPYGYEPLIKILEQIYGGKIIVGSGAKHCLSAAFYAMNAVGKNKIHVVRPFWASIPSLVAREGLEYSESINDCDCQLIVAPGNPDGSFNLSTIANVPVIHDAAYYTGSYVPKEIYLKQIGDIQIYSMSKMFGLSGARIGWVHTYNEEYYTHMTKFIEATTAGISTISQSLLLDILNKDCNNPELRISYEDYVFKYLNINRKYLLENLNTNKFTIIDKNQYGMFAWLKSDVSNFTESGVNVMPGEPFGKPGYIRMNLAVSMELIIKAVNKMNKI